MTRPRGGGFFGLQQRGFAGVGLVGGDDLEQVLAAPGQGGGVVVAGEVEQVPFGLRYQRGVEGLGELGQGVMIART